MNTSDINNEISRKHNAINGDTIWFDNLNKEKNLRYYSSGILDKCCMWYYLNDDFFDIHYLKNDDSIPKKKKNEKKKIQLPDSDTFTHSKDSMNKHIKTDNICSSDILILLNKKKVACKSLSSYIVMESKEKKDKKKYISIEYLVSSYIFIPQNYITLYINNTGRKNVYILSDKNKKILICENSHFTVYYDNKYIKNAFIKCVKGELEIYVTAKSKPAITKLFVQIHNTCKFIFFPIIVRIHELHKLLPNDAHFAEGALVNLVLKRRNSDNEIGNSDYKCERYKMRNILKRSFTAQMIEEMGKIYLKKGSHRTNKIIENIDHINLLKCLEKSYIINFNNNYKILPNENYDIISEEKIKLKKISKKENKTVISVINIWSKQKFSAIIYIYSIKEKKINCLYPIFFDNFQIFSELNSKTYKKDTEMVKEILMSKEIKGLKNHFFYKNNFYFDDLYIERYFKINNQVNRQENFVSGKVYLCILTLYSEHRIQLTYLNRGNYNYNWDIHPKKHNYNVYSIYNFDENIANLFLAAYAINDERVRRKIEVTHDINNISKKSDDKNKIFINVHVEKPIHCFIKNDISMASVFMLLPNEKLYYNCKGLNNRTNPKITIFNKYNFLRIKATDKVIEIIQKDSTDTYNNYNNTKGRKIGNEDKPIKFENQKRVNKKTKLGRLKNNPIVVSLAFCSEHNLINCFVSKIYLVDQINEFKIIVEKKNIEVGEVTNVYLFMESKLDNPIYTKQWKYLKRRRNSNIQKETDYTRNDPPCSEPNCNKGLSNFYGNTSNQNEIGHIKISSCFRTLHNDILIVYENKFVEVINKYWKFQKIKEQFKDACAFIQIKGKIEKKLNRINMIYKKDGKIKKNAYKEFDIYNKVKGILCQDFVCSKFIKFNEISNLIIYDGFYNIPNKITVFSEHTNKNIIIKENRTFNNYNSSWFIFKNIFLLKTFNNVFFFLYENKEKSIYKNMFTGIVSIENTRFNDARHLYNRRLFQYDIIFSALPPVNKFNPGQIIRNTYSDNTKMRKRNKDNRLEKGYNISAFNNYHFFYNPFFRVQKQFFIYCYSSKNKKQISSNIMIEMMGNENESNISTNNFLPVHFKYPYSIKVAIFDRYITDLYVINGSTLFLFKNDSYYIKTFLVDENENVILTNDSFTYKLEPHRKNFYEICFKNKSHYLDAYNNIETPNEHVIKTNTKISLNYKNDLQNFNCNIKNDRSEVKNLFKCTDTHFFLNITYSYENEHVYNYFEKYFTLYFYDNIYACHNTLVLLYSPLIYYKFYIFLPQNDHIRPENLIKSFKGNKQIEVLRFMRGCVIDYSDVKNRGHVFSTDSINSDLPCEYRADEKKQIVVNLDNDVNSRQNKCKSKSGNKIPLYINSKHETKGILTIRHELIYTTNPLKMKIYMDKIWKVKISTIKKYYQVADKIILRLEFLNKYNKKFDFVAHKNINIKLFHNYNNKITMKHIDIYSLHNNNLLKEIKKKFSINDEIQSDIFYNINIKDTGKYFIQIEIKYKLYKNTYLRVVSNMIEIVIYKKGILLNPTTNKIVLHPFNQTMEIVFQFDHPFISTVLCVVRDEHNLGYDQDKRKSPIIFVERVEKLNQGKNIYMCSIKTGNRIGKAKLHIYPIFHSYYEIFSWSMEKEKLINRLDLTFDEIEQYYENHKKYCNYNNINQYKMYANKWGKHKIECIDKEEKTIRHFYFFKIDIIVDYIGSIDLFTNLITKNLNSDMNKEKLESGIIYLPSNNRINTFVSFYAKTEKLPFTFIDFNSIYKINLNTYKLEYFVNYKNIYLNNNIDNIRYLEKMNYRENMGPLKAISTNLENEQKKKILTDLVKEFNPFISIKSCKIGSYLFYVNLISDTNNSIVSQVYNIIFLKKKNSYIGNDNNIPFVHLGANSIYKFNRKYFNLKTLRKYLYLSFSSGIIINTCAETNEFFPLYYYYSNEKSKIKNNSVNLSKNLFEKKIKIKISTIYGAKINNYYSKYVPLNTIQHFLIDLYNKDFEPILFPLNAKLFINISHSSILSAIIVKGKYIFIIPHKIGCSFINIYLKLYKNCIHSYNKFCEASYDYINLESIHLCVTKPIKIKYFYKKNNLYYINRIYKLWGPYNEDFFLQPFVSLNSVIKQNNKQKDKNMPLNRSNFYCNYIYSKDSSYIQNLDDLYESSLKFYSIINDKCTTIKV
ncbi:hypothetical protein Py17XNL_001002137 [Plasmodium yoelii yoelii]|uniref:Uncharacterized protein n=1 Tax=Plasmodium yoelii yoelii TaxID=73239 RepID=A0AAE9WQ10_PLAYO|nr:hypothetical protein Py17XNL_001002137 [Plasmodium yoelii yoelii]